MLPQLTVYAKIIYLLMVVISGALCTVEDYVIMSQCAHNKAIHVAAEGTVSVTDISQTQNITIVGLPDYVNNNLKIALYAKETQRYVCFNDQWKLVGMKELRDTCYFNETIVHGYFVFRSVVDLQRRVGFTHRGKAVGPKKNVNDACYLFTKIQADQFFHQHTDYFAPKAKSTKIISGIRTSPQTTATTTYTTSGASARLSSQRAALSTAATTATATATAVAQRNHNNKLLRNNNKNKRVNGGRSNSNNSSNRNSNNNQNEEYTNGHTSNLSSSNSNNNNHSNSNLVSNSQEQVGLSQQKHHNNNGSSRTREHVRQQQQHQHQQQQQQQQQQQHQVRHHHNDPNLIARRQQHEHKQKRRQNQRQQQRLHTGKITSPTTTKTAKQLASTTATQATFGATAAGATLSSSFKPDKDIQHMPEPATVANIAAKAATAATIVMKATTIANKRKGRRRKGRRQRKQQQLAQLQKLEKEMLPLTAHQLTQAAILPTQTTVDRLWSDSPEPALSSLSTQASGELNSSISSPTTYGDYSGEWLSSVATFAGTTAELSSTSTLSSTASDKSTQTYTLDSVQTSTIDSSDSATLLTPTSDYSNNTDFTSEAFADEERLNATLTTETDDSENLTDPTSAAGQQLNSITSEQLTTAQDGKASAAEGESTSSTSTSWSEASVYSWSPNSVATRATTANENDVQAIFPAPTATMETENVAATVIFPEDVNATVETQTSVDDYELFAAINTTSSEADDFTETMADAESTLSTAVEKRSGENFTGDSDSKSRMWKAQSRIAASIATLLHNQLMATSARNDEYAWRPRRDEEYSDEIVVATERPKVIEADTSTDFAIGDRATWWQQHMNHSGKNFWDKGFADEVIGNVSADYGWFKQNNKHRNASRRIHNSRITSNNSGKDVETVSHQPAHALNTSESSLGNNKKYPGEGKLQRPGNKAYASNKMQVSATAQEYSSTMPTTSRFISARHRQNVINSTTATATSYKTTATTTTSGQPYPFLRLLGNKTISPNPNQPQLLQFDGNSNHLVHTHTPTTTTLITTTKSARPTSTTISNDMTTSTAAATSTTRKSLRISMQKLLATPFHQLTYVRNNAGDINIDNIDNISVYPDLFGESDELASQHSTERAATDVSGNSRLTVVSGYLPTMATVKLPESIRLAKVKINKERKRMMSLRKRHSRRYA